LFKTVNDDFRITVRPKRMSEACQFFAQLPVIVDLAILNNLDPTSLVRYRLPATIHVDDRKPTHSKADETVGEHAVSIGAPMNDRLIHGVNVCTIDSTISQVKPNNAAHQECHFLI
jgi:hypothetical protein